MYKASEFLPYKGQSFRIGPAALVLSAVEEHSSPDAPHPAFTLIFAGPRAPVLPEGSYDACAPGGPAWRFYIIPIHTRDQTRQDYQVVFN